MSQVLNKNNAVPESGSSIEDEPNEQWEQGLLSAVVSTKATHA